MIGLAEKGWVPDSLVRYGIRRLLNTRLQEEVDKYQNEEHALNFVKALREDPIAVHTQEANEQHYELPASFFVEVLGQHKKYSSCFWDDNTKTLSEAEANALRISCEHADLKDGQDVLELGCGWGSLSLWMAEHYPQSQITSVSNSKYQREYIENQCKERGLNNLKVITNNIVHFDIDKKFDRVVSIEMFEHMRNYQTLFDKINKWLKDDGKLFVHIFSHKKYSYLFETEGSSNWMGKYFFTGGIMPSKDLLKEFQGALTLSNTWTWNGQHYQKTAEAWHDNMNERKVHIMPILLDTYGEDAKIWFHRWRIFFLACAELFGYKEGHEWDVSHYLFEKTKKTTS